jgi:hypothetical protein
MAQGVATTRERHPHLGDLLLRFQSAPASATASATGAAGEEALAHHLADGSPDAIVLHDRRMPRSRANIDHLAIAPSGVYIIDARRYAGKIEVRKHARGESRLMIAGRNKTKLIKGLTQQEQAVRAALAQTLPEIPVRACFCFLNPSDQPGGRDLPLLRTLSIDGFPLLCPRKLSKCLNTPGDLNPQSRQEVAELLADAFPSAIR